MKLNKKKSKGLGDDEWTQYSIIICMTLNSGCNLKSA